MDKQPTARAMKIARKYIGELEALGGFSFGDKSWSIIQQMLVELEEPLTAYNRPVSEPFDVEKYFATHPTDEQIAILRSKGYSVKETERGWSPSTPLGFGIIRGWAKTEREAWRHCANHYDQQKDR